MVDVEAHIRALSPEVAEPMRRAWACLSESEPERPIFEHDAYPNMKVTMSPSAQRSIDDPLREAFTAAGFPAHREVVPTPDALTDDQRRLAEIVATTPGLPLHGFAIPQTAWARRRWLGIDPPSVLEGDHGGQPRYVALRGMSQAQVMEALAGLPTAERLDAWVQLAFDPYRMRPPAFEAFETIGDDAGAWASACADWLTALFAEGSSPTERFGHHRLPSWVGWTVMLALVRGGVALQPKWDWMFAVGGKKQASITDELLAQVPEPRRGETLARALGDAFASQALPVGLRLVASYPSVALVDHLVRRADDAISSLMCPPRRDYLAALSDALKDQPELQARVTARLAELPELPDLRTKRAVYVRSLDDLTDGQKTQLAILGQGWEGEDGPIVTMHDGEPQWGSLAYVSAYTIVDGEGAPAYDALLYMDEDGAVCMADTTRSVAYASQMELSCNMGEALLEKLQMLLRVRPPEADA